VLILVLLLALAAAAALWVGQSESTSGGSGIPLVQRLLEKQHKRAEEERWTAERVEAELTREREWNAGPMTPCAEFGRGSGPQVCIEHVGKADALIGTPVEYRVRWRNLPSKAYIRVWSRNAAPAGQRWRYMGPQGAVDGKVLGGSTEGDERLTWDGRSVYCAPSDAPMMCDVGEVGRYVLRAAILTGSDPFWPSWPPLHPVPVVYHAQSETAPFALNGPPQPVGRPGSFRSYPAQQQIVDAIRAALPPGALGNDFYVERRVDRLGPWARQWAQYCARLDLGAPLTGWVAVCFPASRRDQNGIALRPGDISATSHAGLQEGVLRAEEAKAKATAYAVQMTGGRATFSSNPSEEDMVRALYRDPRKYDGSYQGLRNAARDAGLTYVEVNQAYPSFREDSAKGWWLVELGLWIGTVDGPRVQDWGRLALRVDQDGSVCRVDRTGEREGPDRRDVYSDCRPGTRRRL
jgi:hypothetical protein